MQQVSASTKVSTALILFFLSALPITSTAQVTQEWAKVFNRKFEDRPAAITMGPKGNIYVSGRSQDDYVVMCYSPAGDSLARQIITASGSPAGGALVVDDSNYVYLTGYGYAAWPTSNQAITVRCDPFGLLPVTWGTRVSQSSFGNAIAIDDSSNVYITGEIYGLDMFIVKYSRSGLTRWWDVLNFGYYDTGIDIETDKNGYCYVLARSNLSNGNSDFVLVKYDTNGDTLWTARYGGVGGNNIPVSLKLDKAGNAYVSGTIYTGGGQRDNFATLKYDPAGHLKWAATYNGPASYTDQVTAMCLDDSANVIVAGTSDAASADLAVIKYDSSGNRKWVSRFDYHNTNNPAGQICADQPGNIYVNGIVNQPNSPTDNNIVTVKYDRNGNLAWDIVYACPDSVWDRPTGIIVDTVGNVYVLGNSASVTPGNSYDWVTIKYSQGINNVTGTLSNGQEKCYSATQTINVAGNGTTFAVASGSSATMIAGHNIRYHAGTNVQSGGYMRGYISPDDPYCVSRSMPEVLTSQEEPSIGIENSYFKVYPNPTTGNFILELKEDLAVDMVTMDVYGIWGEKVLSAILNEEYKHEFSLSDRPSGVYFIRVITGNKAETVKIIKL